MTRKTSMPSSSTSSARRVKRGQLRGMAAGEDDFHRMRVEGHQHRRHAAGPARLDRVVDQLGVSAMNAVEHADRDDASAPVRGDLVLPPPALHSRKPTARMRGRGCSTSPDQVTDCLNFVTVSPNGNPRDLTDGRPGLPQGHLDRPGVVAEKVSTKMLAERIGVSASTASESIRKLADQGLVDHEKYGAVTLTDGGPQGRAGDGAPAPADGDVPGPRARLQLGRGARRGRGARARRLRPDAGPHRRQAGLSDARPARRSDPGRRRPRAHPGCAAAVGVRGRRHRDRGPHLRRRPGDAAVLRQRRASPWIRG